VGSGGTPSACAKRHISQRQAKSLPALGGLSVLLSVLVDQGRRVAAAPAVQDSLGDSRALQPPQAPQPPPQATPGPPQCPADAAAGFHSQSLWADRAQSLAVPIGRPEGPDYRLPAGLGSADRGRGSCGLACSLSSIRYRSNASPGGRDSASGRDHRALGHQSRSGEAPPQAAPSQAPSRSRSTSACAYSGWLLPDRSIRQLLPARRVLPTCGRRDDRSGW
jgi:hypothetical protein